MELLSIDEIEAARRLLRAHLPETIHLLSCLEWPRRKWEFWVDSRKEPQVLLIRREEWLSVFAADALLFEAHLGELPPFAVPEGEEKGLLKFSALLPHLARPVKSLWGSLRESPCYLFALTAQNFRHHDLDGIGPLRVEDAPLIARNWTHGDDVEYCRSRIASGPGFGLRKWGRLIAWMLTHEDGSMGILHTLEGWRRRGYGRGVASALTEKIIEEGKRPFCFVLQDNEPSVRLFESLGFQRVAECFWLVTKPKV